MKTRTTLWIVVLSLLAVGLASASGAATNAETRQRLADAAAPYALFPAQRDAAPAFALGVDAHEKRGMPGDVVTFAVYGKARETLTLALDLDSPYRAAFSPDEITIGPDTRGAAKLRVQIPAEGADRSAVIIVKATAAETGETKAIRVVVHTAAAPAKDTTERPSERPTERPTAGLRMQLSPEHARFAEGPDGIVHGRVAVLLYGGPDGAQAHLKLRMPDGVSWRATLEQERVDVPANGRTFVWVHFEGRPSADDLVYGVIASTPQGDTHAKGTVGVAKR